jgi:hypothetical protein
MCFAAPCPQPGFIECLSQILVAPAFWVYTLAILIIAYLIVTGANYLYYRKK